MIVGIEYLISTDEFCQIPEEVLEMKLDAIESLIRSYTNNNFQNRSIRFSGNSSGRQIFGSSPFLKVGDTVQISHSKVNDGLYVVAGVAEDSIEVNRGLFEVPCNMVTKVEYPAVIKDGVINLLRWEIENRKKVGIKSETLSRHSVTYYDQDANNQIMGYPVSLLGFLKPFMKARF